MSGWRKFAEGIRDDCDPVTEGGRVPSETSFVPFVPIVPGASPREPASVLRTWHGHLSALNDGRPPQGVPRLRWLQLCEDACWIYENFASRAVRDGWSEHDLFGVLPWHLGWGGLCDRIEGARNLKMAGQKAVWSSWGVPDWTCAGAGDGLVKSGLVLIWNMGGAA